MMRNESKLAKECRRRISAARYKSEQARNRYDFSQESYYIGQINAYRRVLRFLDEAQGRIKYKIWLPDYDDYYSGMTCLMDNTFYPCLEETEQEHMYDNKESAQRAGKLLLSRCLGVNVFIVKEVLI